MSPGLWKRARRELRVRALLLFLPLLRRLPHRLLVAIGGAVGTIAWYVVPKERRRALEGLRIAFPDRGESWRRRIGRQSFRNLGRSALELAAFDRIPLERVEIPVEDEQVLRSAHAEGRGVVFVTCHVGNWELLARRIGSLGLPCGTVAREAKDRRLTALLEQSRKSAGVRLVWRGAPGAAREMLRLLRDGAILGVLIDQDIDVQGQFVPFFGHPAFTPRAAGDLAIRTGAPVVFGCAHRVAPTLHRLVFRRIEVARVGDREADSLAITAAATRAIEEEVRASPSEWVWMHPRWRTRPPP